MAFVKQQFTKLSRFLYPIPQWNNLSMTYYGHNGAKIKDLADAWGLNIKVVDCDETTISQDILSQKNQKEANTYVVYDVDNFSLSTVLTNLEANQNYLLGTYHSHSGNLITAEFVYTAENNRK